jgi:hypothetical protein
MSINRREALSVVAAVPVALAATAIAAGSIASESPSAKMSLAEPDALTSYRDFVRATAHLTEHQKGKLADALEALQS